MNFDFEKFIAYCEKSADTVAGLKEKCYESAAAGGPDSVLSAIPYFSQRENMFRYEIPSFVRQYLEDQQKAEAGITEISVQQVYELRAEDTALILVDGTDGNCVKMIAELENDENTDAPCPVRVNGYPGWTLDLDSGRTLTEEFRYQCGTHAGGIVSENPDDPFEYLEEYIGDEAFTCIQLAPEKDVSSLKILPPGYYIVVFGKPNSLYSWEE